MKKANLTISALILILVLSSCQQTPSDIETIGNDNEQITENEDSNTDTDEDTEMNDNEEEAEEDTVLYFVKLEDKGANGELIGCDDSLIAQTVEMDISKDRAENVKSALNNLLSIKESEYGTEKLYNSIGSLDLEVDNVIDNDERVQVILSGTLQIGGACEVPRIKAQLIETAKQFLDEDTGLDMMINGKTINEALSSK